MNYVLSDIHNDFSKLVRMLEIIKFSENDTLYVLGDMFDRGGEVADPLGIYFHLLKNEHRYKLVRGNHDTCLGKYIQHYYRIPECKRQTIERYPYNSFEILSKRLPPVDMLQMADWILSMPVQREITINGEKYLLAHAMTALPDVKMPEECFLLGEEMDTGYLREGIDGVISICGHRSTSNGKIWKNERGNLYLCDCGCGYRSGKLGCLCLETKEEFYV